MEAGSGSSSRGLRLSPGKAGSVAPSVWISACTVFTPSSWALHPLRLLKWGCVPAESVGLDSLKSRTLAVRTKDCGTVWDQTGFGPKASKVRNRQRAGRAVTGEGMRLIMVVLRLRERPGWVVPCFAQDPGWP